MDIMRLNANSTVAECKKNESVHEMAENAAVAALSGPGAPAGPASISDRNRVPLAGEGAARVDEPARESRPAPGHVSAAAETESNDAPERLQKNRAESSAAPSESLLDEARKTFLLQSSVIADLARRIDGGYSRAIAIILSTNGHVVVSGMGKSGLIGRKIASTFSSTGTPSFFLHPADALHGDLGMIRPKDTLLLISYSGETEEVIRLIPHLRRLEVPIISLVGRMGSTLARHSDVVVEVSVDREVCPNNLAPTNSTLATLAMGDAMAASLVRERHFLPRDFALFHPGGRLGRRLFARVKDAMRRSALPRVSPGQSVRESLVTMTAGRLGLVLVMEGERLLGIVTDGDLRRALQRLDNILDVAVSEIMTPEPVTIHENTVLTEAEERMVSKKIKALVVLDDAGKVSGILEIFDG